MAVEVTLDNIVPASVPADGWIVGYRILGTLGPYITPGGSPYVAQPIVFNTADPAGTLYEGFIQSDCGALTSTLFFWQTPCGCTTVGYVPSPSGLICELYETQAPTITDSGFCLAASQHPNYSGTESRIYNPGYVDADIQIVAGTVGGIIYGRMTIPYWKGSGSGTDGPMNREGVWIDSDCNGTKDPLTMGAETTIAYVFNNPGPAKTIHVGIGGDNLFTLIVNGTQLVETGVISGNNFNIFHIFPITVQTGPNYINVVATGDGTTNDAVAVVVYDNTAAQILAATSDLDLNIVFRTGTLIGTSYSVATCPAGWSLDVSGGEGFYVCRRTLTEPCNSL